MRDNSWRLQISVLKHLNDRVKVSWLKFGILQPLWHLHYFEHEKISQHLRAVQLYSTHHKNLLGNLHLASSCFDAHILDSLIITVLRCEVVRVQDIFEGWDVDTINSHLLLVRVSAYRLHENRVLRLKEAWNVSRHTSRSQCNTSLSPHLLSSICGLRILRLWEVKLSKFIYVRAPHIFAVVVVTIWIIMWENKIR